MHLNQAAISGPPVNTYLYNADQRKILHPKLLKNHNNTIFLTNNTVSVFSR